MCEGFCCPPRMTCALSVGSFMFLYRDWLSDGHLGKWPGFCKKKFANLFEKQKMIYLRSVIGREKRYLEPSLRQQFFAWVMLLVYLPMVLLSSGHVHSWQEFSKSIDCYQCETGLHHCGHITVDSPHHDECLLCRFMGMQVVVPDQQDHDQDILQAVKVEFCQVTESFSRSVAHPTLRAPPVLL